MPVASLSESFSHGPHERPSWQQLPDSAEKSFLAGDEAGGEKLGQDGVVELGPERIGCQDAFDLRGEQEFAVGQGVIERFDAQAVPGQEELSLGPVPDGEGKHPLEPLDAALSFFLIEMEDRLGITTGAIAVSSGLQFPSDLGMVVDLAVEDNPDGPILVCHRLMSTSYIHDRQSPVT